MTTRPAPEPLRVVGLIGELGYGGSEKQLFLTMRELSNRGAKCHVVVFNKSSYLAYNDALRASGVEVWEMPEDVRNVPSRTRFIYRLLRKVRPHVVHSWTAHDNPHAGIVGKLAGVPVRLGSIRGSLQVSLLKSWQRWLAVRSVPGIVVNARSLRGELIDLGVAAKRISMVRNCVEVSKRPLGPRRTLPLFAALGIDEGHRVVATVGNLRRFKRQTMFVEAMARLVELHPDVRGLIVGQPIPHEMDVPEAIKAAIERNGLRGRVAMTGFQSDIPLFMHSLDIFCTTSTAEGTPNAVLEAMAAGLPIVATRVSGIPDIIRTGTEGLLVEPDDLDQLVKALDLLLTDHDLARKLGESARKRASEEFSCARTAESLTHLYEEALAGRPFWQMPPKEPAEWAHS